MINENAIKAVFERSLKLQSDETCLIVTDTEKEGIGRAFYEYALQITPETEIIVISPTEEHGAEPPCEVAGKMLNKDVQLLITSKSLTHTAARREATARGARIATMPAIVEDIVNRCMDIDYDKLRSESQQLYQVLKNAGSIRVTTASGTDIEFSVGSSDFFGKDGGVYDYPGAYGNLPEGEVAFGPETCDGTYVVDVSFCGLGLLGSPLTFKVKSGMVTDISGERSGELKERLDKAGPKAYLVAELGIGLNPKAKVIGNILEDEKVIGTVHIALGNNCSFGRDNDVPIHLDGVITKPTVMVDGRKIMADGKFV